MLSIRINDEAIEIEEDGHVTTMPLAKAWRFAFEPCYRRWWRAVKRLAVRLFRC